MDISELFIGMVPRGQVWKGGVLVKSITCVSLVAQQRSPGVIAASELVTVAADGPAGEAVPAGAVALCSPSAFPLPPQPCLPAMEQTPQCGKQLRQCAGCAAPLNTVVWGSEGGSGQGTWRSSAARVSICASGVNLYQSAKPGST